MNPTKNFSSIAFLFATITTLTLTGCATPNQLSQAASAEKMPCEASKIVISDMKGFGVRHWKATCKGKTYQCSASVPGNGTLQNVSCKP